MGCGWRVLATLEDRGPNKYIHKLWTLSLEQEQKDTVATTLGMWMTERSLRRFQDSL